MHTACILGYALAPRDLDPTLVEEREVIDMIEPADAGEFLSLNRLALVRASDDAKSFSKTVYREMREHGHDVVAVNPNATTVDGDPCYPDLAATTACTSSPGPVRSCSWNRWPGSRNIAPCAI